ncbi:hypothetical protein A8B82_09195 [Sulfitobacter sp. EhC04]|nr:hypothetical protein A8B82_09195 [Sulfitobacter sp. EhC04]
MQVRARPDEGEVDDALGRIMYDAIHHGPSQYSLAERQAWLPTPNAGEGWRARLSAQKVWVAYDKTGPVGFMTLDGDYIDLAFVAAASQGRGVFRALFAQVEAAARGQRRLWTHASLMAQPAFLAVGFRVIRHENVAQGGEVLRRAEMEKMLA